MRLYDVHDAEFLEFGQVLEGYDFKELILKLSSKDIPQNDIFYTASCDDLEKCSIFGEFKRRGFGGYDIQIGYVSGQNRVLNCLEYHKSSEFNIAADDVVLVLGREQDIKNGQFDTSKCKAFFVKAGTGVELFATTLHYAPFNVNDEGYVVACVLPKGTNGEKVPLDAFSFEDKLCFGVNKWLMAHPDSKDAKKNGAYACLSGENITLDMIEEI